MCSPLSNMKATHRESVLIFILISVRCSVRRAAGDRQRGGGVISVKHESYNTGKQYSHRTFTNNLITVKIQIMAFRLRLLHDLQ